MKKTLIGLVSALAFIGLQSTFAVYIQGSQHDGLSVGTEWFFNQQDLSAPKSQAQCTEFWGSSNYYLAGDLDNDGTPDMGQPWYFKDNFTYNSKAGSRGVALIVPTMTGYNGTTVSYYTPQSNMLSVYWNGTQYSLNNTTVWYRYSKVAPLNQPVRAATSEPFLVEAPSSNSRTDATMQFVYDINFATFSSWGSAASSYFVATVPSLTNFDAISNSQKWFMKASLTDPDGPLRSNDYANQTTSINARSINWGPEIKHGSECFNVTTHWCGDGIVDNKTFDNSITASEQCDLGSQNGQPGSLCSATCTLIPVPAIPDVSIVKSVEGKTNGYMTGDTITYKLIVRNIGTGLATNVVVSDLLPAGVTYIAGSTKFATGVSTEPTYDANANMLRWSMGNMVAGYYNEITFSVKLNVAPYCAPFRNDATIAPAPTDGETNTGNNSSWATFYTDCTSPDVLTTKKVEAISGSYMPGQTVKYTLTYKNQGSGTANGVVVTDTLPAEVTYVPNSSVSTPEIGQPTVNGNKLTWNVGTLVSQAGGSITILVTIKATAPVCTQLEVHNDFTISATNEPNTVLENNPSWADFYMECVDLRSNKVVDKPTVYSGDIVTYTISYGNSGSIATGGTVIDTLPAKTEYIVDSSTSTQNVGQPTVNGNKLTWNVGVLQPGFKGTISFKARILGPVAADQVFLNNVCIEGETYNPTNNCGNAISNTNPYFDLSINKTPKSRKVAVGDIFDYTLTVSNNGTTGVNNFTVKDYLPAGLEFISGSNNPTYTSGNRTIVWNGLNIGAVGSFNLTVRVKYVGPITNGVETNWTEICDYNGMGNGSGQDTTNPHDTDSNPCNGTGNNEDDVSSGSINPTNDYYDLSMDKLIDGQKTKTNVPVGTVVTISLTVTNSGTVGVTGFSVKDYMPADLEYKDGTVTVAGSATTAAASYSGSARQLTISNLTIGATGKITITFQATYNGTVTRTNYTEICDYTGISYTGIDAKDIDSNPCNRGANPQIEDDESSAQISPYTQPNPPINPPGNPTDVCGNGYWAPTNGEKCDMGPNGGIIPAGAGYPAEAVGKWCYGTTPEQQKLGRACTYNGLTCGDGIRGTGEVCDVGTSGGIIPLRDKEGKLNPYVGRYCYGTNSQYACTIKSSLEDTPTCSYIDPPSIQQGEYLPFWWDLESKKLSKDLDNTDFVTSCVSGSVVSPDKLQIVRDSVQCEFTVKNTQGQLEGFTQSCFTNNLTNKTLVESAYTSTLRSMGYSSSEFPTPAGFDARIFQFKATALGEHSIDVKVSSYASCNVVNGKLDGTSTVVNTSNQERVCQMNFAVTKPYIVSRGALGDYTTDSYGLKEFLQFPKGDAVFTSPIPLLTTSYDPTPDVQNEVNKLVEDYKKIAVKATEATFYSNNTKVDVYKIPNKEIYIFSPDNDNATITIDGDKKNDKPFTFILTRGKLVVKDNTTNLKGMFIVQNGDIHFSPKDCNTKQEVSGIFISLRNITSDAGYGSSRQSAHNTDLNQPWCSEGSLTINGILIGNNIKDITAGSRSLLDTRRSDANSWFEDLSVIPQPIERQNYLKEQAAVVLKYNPSIFSNLPPGADTLSQILNVYKK